MNCIFLNVLFDAKRRYIFPACEFCHEQELSPIR